MTIEDTNLEAKLDLLIGLLRIAHRDELAERRGQVIADPVSRAILRACARHWVDAGKLKALAAKSGKASRPTAERRIAELLAEGVLRRQGSGPTVRYRASGLIDP